MKNFSSIFGWILLTAVLAVPSVLFYNWWTANKAKEAQLAASQQGVPRGFFPGEEKPAGEAVLSSTPAADSQPLVTPDQAGPTGDAMPHSVPAADTQSAAADPVSVSSPAVAVAAEAAEGSPEAASYFNPKTKRDPFLTPDDYARMRAEESRRRQEARDRSQQEVRQKPREVPVESRLNIQGIVGSDVIINGEMYARGDTVLGAKIVSIGTNYIIGEHKGRRFRKYMQ